MSFHYSIRSIGKDDCDPPGLACLEGHKKIRCNRVSAVLMIVKSGTTGSADCKGHANAATNMVIDSPWKKLRVEFPYLKQDGQYMMSEDSIQQ